jgi:hypothetical protein
MILKRRKIGWKGKGHRLTFDPPNLIYLANQRPFNEGSVLKMPAGTKITNIPLATRRLQAAEMPVTGKPGTDVADLFSLSEVPMRKYKAPFEANGMEAIQRLHVANPRQHCRALAKLTWA